MNLHSCLYSLALLLKTKGLLMKAFFLGILLVSGGLLVARDSSGQDLDRMTLSIQLKNVTLKHALRKIEALTSLPFTYKTNDVAGYDNINYQANNVSVARLLEALLQHTGLQYEQVNNNIIIKKIKDNPQAPANARADAPLFDGGIKG